MSIPAWQQLEADYDLAREEARASMRERRLTRFWPAIGGALLIAAPLVTALIEGSL